MVTPVEQPLRVRDVLRWDDFPIDLVAGSRGVDRVVRWAHPSELLDPSPFLRGGEIVLTVGIELRTEGDCERFVHALLRSEAAGIGLAVDVIDHTPPDALRTFADRYALPMFTVPPTLPFVAFTERLAAMQAHRREVTRRLADDGRLLEFIRQDLASPWVLRERLDADSGARFGAVTVPAGTRVAIDAPHVEGLVADRLILVADELSLAALVEGLDAPTHGSGGVDGLDRLPRSLKESAAAYAMARSSARPHGPRDLASFTGLVERMSADQLAPFRDHILVPLERHDARHGTQLLLTLERYLDAEGAVAEAARRLHLHENSVRNRLARISRITRLDPARFHDRIAFALAVESFRR